jgi:Flp pilus assembly protein TadD/ribosomal protein L40E
MSRDVLVCPSCEAKNHPKWRACQRCGAELVRPATDRKQTAPKSGLADEQRSSSARWMIAGGAGALVIAAAVGLPRVWPGASPSAPISGKPASAAPLTTSTTVTGAERRGPGLAADTTNELIHQSSAAYQRGDFNAALDMLGRAVAANPGDVVAQNNLGQVLVRLNRVPEALPHLAAAVKDAPDEWSYRFNLARAQGLAGDWGSAVESYQQADQLFPNDHVTMFNLAQALQKANRSADALPVLERVVAAAPDDPSFLLSLGSAYERAGRSADASATYSKYLDRLPSAPDAAAVKAHIARLQGGEAPAMSLPAAAAPQATPEAPQEPVTGSPERPPDPKP